MFRLVGFRAAAIMVLTLYMFGCGLTSHSGSSDFDAKSFETFAGSSILCFDLRSENGPPSAGILLRVAQTIPGSRHDLVLPFSTSTVTPNRKVLLTSAGYEGFTVLTFSFGRPSLGTSIVALTPELASFSEGTPQVDALEPGVYFHENGLERWFAYVDGTSQIISALQTDFPSTAFETADAIAVALPEKAEGRDIKRGVSVDPLPNARVRNAMLFTSAAGLSPKRIALRYAVPPTPAQAAAASSGLKVALLLFIPILTLIFIDPEDVHRPRLRTAGIWTGIILQAIIGGYVAWVTIAIRRPMAEALFDFTIAGLGIIAQVVIILVKSKRGINNGGPPNKAIHLTSDSRS